MIESTEQSVGRVAVIGAGPGGLSAGIALSQAGFDVKIYERAAQLEPLGGAILLNAIGIYILRSYGADVSGIKPFDKVEYRRYDGHLRAVRETAPELLRRAGVEGWTSGLMRSSLYEKLLALVPEGMIVPSKRLQSLEQLEDRAVIRFDDGTAEEADLVVGADGINSVVRAHLWDADAPEPLGITVWLGWSPGVAGPRDEMIVRHNDLHQFGTAPLDFDGEECFEWWFVEPSRTDGYVPENPYAYIRERVRRFEHPVVALVDAAERGGGVFHWPIMNRVPLQAWTKGRATLLGDAAHPTSPYAGYGAGMAIEDGFFLGRFLEGRDLTDPAQLAEGLERYDRERVPYTNGVTAAARALGRSFHNLPWLKRRIRDFKLDYTKGPERSIVQGYNASAHGLLRSLLEAEQDRSGAEPAQDRG